jgi:UDP-2-acetamido-2-deoxy-ribo-hexuluronate aminotransferase
MRRPNKILIACLCPLSLRPVKTSPEIRPIQMVDLTSQYQRLKADIDTAISDVLTNASYINGPIVKTFGRELESYLKVKHVIPCANGTDALQMAFMALDLPDGSEVITPGFSYIALAEVCALLKLKPVFADVDMQTFNLDPLQIEKHITPMTKVIAPVHLYGQCADMETILAIAEKHNLHVIEDNAQSIGADYTFSDGKTCKAGGIAHIGTTSFFPSKNLGCYGDGGAVMTNDDRLAERIRMVANHGQKVKYIHDVVGVNSRLDSVQAAVLSVKLKMLDTFNAERQAVAKAYDEAFAGHDHIRTPSRNKKSTHVFHQYTLQLCNADVTAFRTYMQEHGVPTMIYYPMPIYRQKAYEQPIEMPVAEILCRSVVSLPIGTEMDQAQIDFIISTVKNYFKL